MAEGRAAVEVVETYRGHTITTRSSTHEGYRVLLPHGQGILDFTNSSDISEARKLVDKNVDGGW